jgi:hypothetical protein
MKKFQKVLSEKTLSLVDTEIEQKISKNEWRTSSINWAPELQRGWPGTTSISLAYPETAEKIENEIKQFLPTYSKLCVQFYIWHPLSAINAHPDTNHLFGCTIYLNKSWHVDYGGLFIWSKIDSNGEESTHMEMPFRNTMVLNDEREWHLVTPVSTASPENRVTIQIWGD